MYQVGILSRILNPLRIGYLSSSLAHLCPPRGSTTRKTVTHLLNQACLGGRVSRLENRCARSDSVPNAICDNSVATTWGKTGPVVFPFFKELVENNMDIALNR